MRLNSLEIQSLRGIRDLKLNDFQDVNLLLGDNDAGKTTVLEAIMLCMAPEDIAQVVRSSRCRMNGNLTRDRYTQFETFMHLFPFSNKKEKTIALRMEVDGEQHNFELSGALVTMLRPSESRGRKGMEEDGTPEQEIAAFDGTLRYDKYEFPVSVPADYSYKLAANTLMGDEVVYLSPAAHLNGRNHIPFSLKPLRQRTLELMRILDPDIQDLRLKKSEAGLGTNQMIEHSKWGEVPLYTYGDGMKKILTLASSVAEAENGILLIDEIETSLQAVHLAQVSEWLVQACEQYHVQLFVTTHSLEAVSTLSRCLSDVPSELACYRLERSSEETKVKRFSERVLEDLVNGSGIDVR